MGREARVKDPVQDRLHRDHRGEEEEQGQAARGEGQTGAETKPGNVVSIMDALRKSVAANPGKTGQRS